MATRSLAKPLMKPRVFEDFFKPFNEFFDAPTWFGKTMNMPPVNIREEKDAYILELAAPGYVKDDFKIDIDNYMLSISMEKETREEEKEENFTRREYDYTNFSRSFTLPEYVKLEAIEAFYKDGILQIKLPLIEGKVMGTTKHITVK